MWKRSLIKNKVYAVLIMLLGAVPMIVDGDGTFFIFAMALGVPLFFSKKNLIT